VLREVYDRRDVPPGSVIGITSNTVPWELIRAAGFQPFLLSPRRPVTPLADRFMEGVFTARMRSIFDFLLSPDSAALSAVIIPRTSEQEHKLYLYLREVLREGVERAPRPILYNLLHSRSTEAETYGLERTRELKAQLEQLAGRSIQPEAMRAAIEEGNAARQAIRDLMQLREGARQKLSGAEALALIGAWYFMDRGEYARLAREALTELENRAPMEGPRLLVKGVPQSDADFYAAVEAEGATIVAEDDWFGSRAAGRDVEVAHDPLQTIFEKYYFDAPSPRVFPSAIAEEWFRRKASEVDGVIFYLPDEDDVLGWDYPRLRSFLHERGIPHLLARTACPAPIRAFVESLRRA
jgi:benzoyl-CoA reductase/2-hydroxyglutaryl-CoA dehydratase subunit BcrC/BadD/HgdB